MKIKKTVNKGALLGLLVALSCFSTTLSWASPGVDSTEAHSDIDESTVAVLHNDDRSDTEADHVDHIVYHREYEEELELDKIEQELEYHDSELSNADEAKLEIEIENSQYGRGGIPDLSPRTSFFSDEDHKDSGTSIFDSATDSDFFYAHQLPPGIRPDLASDPSFNDFDFTSNLLEFELEIEGFFNDGGASTFDVYLFDLKYSETGSGFNDTTPMLAGLQADEVNDLAKLGEISYDGSGQDEFELEFEQVTTEDSSISHEIYQALATGILGIHIQRTYGDAAMYLSESELELEKAAPVPEPSSLLLFGTGFIALSWLIRRKGSKESPVA